MSQPAMRIGRWIFSPELHLLRSNGIERHLEPKQAEVLKRLVAEPGAVVTKSELLDTVWADVCVTEEVLTNTIYQLRRALGDSAREQQYVQTIPKRGYRLVAEVSPATGDGKTEIWPARRAAAAVGVIAIVLILIGGLARTEGDGSRRSISLVEAGETSLEEGTAVSEADAVRLFERATVLDSGLPSAWGGLAAARWALVSRGEMSVAVGLPLVEEAAIRALDLDPALPRPWRILGLVKITRWEWAEAERALTKAIELGPEAAEAHGSYAEFLLLTGRRAEAKREIETALELAPDSRNVLMTAGFVYTMLRDVELAAGAYRAILSLDPGDREAREQIEKLSRRDEPPGGSGLTVPKIDQILRKQPLRPAIVAGMFAEAGEDEKAMEWLRRAKEEKDLSLLLVRLDDRWVRLHDDERFRAILNDVGF